MSYPIHDDDCGPDGPGPLRPLPPIDPGIAQRAEARERVAQIERECHEAGYCSPIDADNLIYFRSIANPTTS